MMASRLLPTLTHFTRKKEIEIQKHSMAELQNSDIATGQDVRMGVRSKHCISYNRKLSPDERDETNSVSER